MLPGLSTPQDWPGKPASALTPPGTFSYLPYLHWGFISVIFALQCSYLICTFPSYSSFMFGCVTIAEQFLLLIYLFFFALLVGAVSFRSCTCCRIDKVFKTCEQLHLSSSDAPSPHIHSQGAQTCREKPVGYHHDQENHCIHACQLVLSLIQTAKQSINLSLRRMFTAYPDSCAKSRPHPRLVRSSCSFDV